MIGNTVNGISFHLLAPNWKVKTLDCISKSFTSPNSDPFQMKYTFKQKDWKYIANLFVERATKKDNPMSLIAYNDNLGRVEGVIINEDFKEPLPDNYNNLPEIWRPVRAIFKELHMRYLAQRLSFKPGNVLHPLYFSCVRPESRRQGITRELWRRSIETAREFNYQFMAAEASTQIARTVCTRLGFEEKAAVKYNEWMFEGEKVFSDLASAKKEYDRIAIFERKITSDLFV